MSEPKIWTRVCVSDKLSGRGKRREHVRWQHLYSSAPKPYLKAVGSAKSHLLGKIVKENRLFHTCPFQDFTPLSLKHLVLDIIEDKT